MGVSSSASVIIGFEVRHEDFWVTKTVKDNFISCPSGHKGNKVGKFCPDCGGELDYQSREETTINPNFEKYIGDNDPQGPAGEAWNPEPERYREEQMGSSGWPKGFSLHCADAMGGSDDDEVLRVIGVEPLAVGDICGGCDTSKTQSLDERDISELFSDVQDLANKLGIDRPARLYLTTYCSY